MQNTFEGKPCKKCGCTLRYYMALAKAGCCVACHKTYNKKPERRQADRERSKSPEYRQARRERDKSPERREWNRQRSKTPQRKSYLVGWRLRPEVKAKIAESHRKYCRTPKGHAINVVSWQKRRALELQAEGSHTAQEWLDLKAKWNNRCLCCGISEEELALRPKHRVLEQDHIIPLSKGGSNWINNIQPLCRSCNGSGVKGAYTNDFRKTPHPFCYATTSIPT